jgi:hypothetical protein
MNKKVIFIIISMLAFMFLLTGCMPGDGSYTPSDPAGFFWGIWHGWIAPISLIVGLFNKSIRIYEIVNTGWWYDFGFYIAIISGFGGLSLFRKKKYKDKD